MIFEKIRDLIVDRTHCDEEIVTIDASLKDDLYLDSFDLAELGIEFEDAFSVTISDDELYGFQTIADIVDWIAEHEQATD